ncbi:MAG TPA: aminomethyltransferase beta-barrel domain-containing protein, partial [Acidobacteriaceae bacterium]|nr:aminomethyltransferase beta-barrel domain-containing protein [Acidobacteriaceae bacterium]
FLDAYLADRGESIPDTSGELVTTSGEVVGQHQGIHNFTVGQRKGLGLGSAGNVTAGSPLYVIGINGAEKKVVVGSSEELVSKSLRANRLNWIAIPSLEAKLRVEVKIRHRHEPAWATLAMSGEDEVTAIFDEPQRAVTPGQAAVFYNGEEVVGGGWIL